MWKLPTDGTYILLLRRSRLFGSVDYWLSAEICFVTIRLLGRAERISQHRVSRSTTVAVWREGKRRTVAHIKTVSCS